MQHPPGLSIDYYPEKNLVIPPQVEARVRESMKGAKRPLPKPQAVRAILSLAGDRGKAITRIALHDGEGDMPSIVEAWTENSYLARKELYQMSMEVVEKTGWAFYVQGMQLPERTGRYANLIQRALRHRARCGSGNLYKGLGRARTIENAYGGMITGNCAIVTGEDGAVVLDCGENVKRIDAISLGKETLVLVSHAHDDHIGNLNNFIEDGSSFIGIGQVTLELYMSAIDAREGDALDYLEEFEVWPRLMLLDYGSPLNFPDGSSISVMDVDHFMGSMAFALRFSDGMRLLYSGDFSCRSRYSQLLRSMRNPDERPESLPGRHDIAILDGSLVSRELPSVANNAALAMGMVPQANSGEDLRGFVEKTIHSGRHCVILAPPRDYGLYTFLYLYDILVDLRSGVDYIPIIADGEVLHYLALLEWHAKGGDGRHIDSFMREFAGGQNLYSSARLFRFSGSGDVNLKAIVDEAIPSVLMLDPYRIARKDYISDDEVGRLKKQGARTGLVGKAVLEYNRQGEPRMPADRVFDTSKWMLHSTDGELKAFLERRRKDFGRVLIFHAPEDRVRRFAGNLQPDARDWCRPLNRVSLP